MTLSCLPQGIFILTRFEKWLGRAISTAVSGQMFSLAYLRRRSALEPVTAHAFSDVLAILSATMLARSSCRAPCPAVRNLRYRGSQFCSRSIVAAVNNSLKPTRLNRLRAP